MRQLLQFLSKHGSFFLLLIYGLISLGMMFSLSTYHKSFYFGSYNRVVGGIYSASAGISAYLGSAKECEVLSKKNIELQDKISQLEEQLRATQLSSNTSDSTQIHKKTPQYDYMQAMVVNNSISRLNNYITLNKGAADGIREEMGVADHNGIVGIVERVSEHYAVVLPILNTKLRISCKVKGSNYFGSMIWDGENPHIAILEELPRHVDFVVGDTIVTSGYSTVFPEGLMVGTIYEYKKSRNDDFYSLKVRLTTDYSSLRYVRVINNALQKEQLTLEQETESND